MLNIFRRFLLKKTIRKIRKRNLTYVTERKMEVIAEACLDAEARKIEGIFVEAGCALGGSSIFIGKLKNKNRVFNIYDVFGMIPAPTAEDSEDVRNRYKVISQGKSSGIGGDKYYGYEKDLLSLVKKNFHEFGVDPESNNIFFNEGLLQDTMHFNTKIAFAHIDVDWYDPVKTSFERIFPNLAIGGSIIFDDYDAWQSCKRAVDECLEFYKGKCVSDASAGSMKVTKIED